MLSCILITFLISQEEVLASICQAASSVNHPGTDRKVPEGGDPSSAVRGGV